jgi:amino acid adenylation domain-containing protein
MPGPSTAGFQLSPQQKHLCSLPGGRRRSAQLALLLEGLVDVQRLQHALQKIVKRHEILRTTFQRNSGMKFPFQVVNDDAVPHWSQTDLRSMNATAQEHRLGELFAVNAEVDVEHPPTVQANLVALSNERHVFIIRLPSLCADTTTLRNLSVELARLYANPGGSATESLQYADYSEWQNELLQKADESSQPGKDYWNSHDFSATPPLAFPFQLKPEGDQDFCPATISIQLHRDVLERINSVSSEDARNILLCCWQVLLWRLTGQLEVVIGYVSDGRTQEELGSALGLFTKTMPLHTNFEPDLPFAELLKQMGQGESEITDWQDYFPLARMEQELPVGFSIKNTFQAQTADGLSFSIYEERCHSDRFHLELRCIADGALAGAELAYDPAYFRRDVAERIARRFSILLNAAVADPNTLVSKLPIMDADERRQVVISFNQTTADYPRHKCIHQLFEEQAARTPDRPALRFAEHELSYTQLNARANQLAHLLRKRGVHANVPVGLCVERSAEMIIGLLGILKAGGCYVPLAPDNPKQRLAHQLSETATPVVLTQEKLLQHLPEFSGETFCLDRDRALLEKEPTNNPRQNNTPEDLVYVIYTSGSTGLPKGVAVQHLNLVNYSNFICRRLGVAQTSPELHFATVSTISADLGNTCIFPALISGGCLHVIDYEMAMAANLFASYAAQHPIDVLKITPSHLSTLLNAHEGKAILPRKFLVLGGEALSWHLVNRVLQASDCSVINHYGPTEATVGCCTFAAQDNDVSAWAPATVPIGRPIANDEIYILDQHLQPVPIGVPGELCIGGAGLARGYMNQPQQTAERFIPHPFSNDHSARLYRTGDLARFLPDGNVEFMGRIDHQVKIRGFRVEPAEIEAVLKLHSSVRQSVIVPYQDKSGDKRLAAYVVATKQTKVEQVRAFLLEHLPEHMVPSTIVLIESLPLTPNGKIDLRALPSPEGGSAQAQREFVTPRNPAEQNLVAIWTEVLKLDRIGVNDNFFELGGHSLLATQIISRIRSTFRVQLPLHSFLETPTVSGLAEKISQCPVAETEDQEMARLLQELEGVSDEEAERLLAAEMEKNNDRGTGSSGQ